MKRLTFLIIVVSLASNQALAQLVIVNGPTDIIVRTGAIGIMPCGFVNADINFQPVWNIVTRSDDGSVISNMTAITANEINSDNNNDNGDRLVYEPDITSGPNNATNSRLLVGPVDETHNQSSYQCLFDLATDDVVSSVGTITVADVSAVVPGVTVDIRSISIDMDIVNLTLSWGEPFNNFDPILNYTVSCSGDDACPLNFTTTDNTTRSYTITDLTPMTTYTFSVVAINSIGSGEAGVVMITTPPGVPAVVPNVTVDDNTININGTIVTLILSWGEPFNNFDPIVNYTVSCSGDNTCPPNFTTTDNTIRSYTITNLTTITTYTFSVVATNSIGSGEAGVLNYTTLPDVPVPNVTVDDNTININGNNVTLTLSWGVPFNNLDPIVNYTVSCSGDFRCPPTFTTTDNTTRSYTITNLTPMTTYTFSVVATNSVGSGQAGVVNVTTPAIDQVTGVNLTCEPVDLDNECNVMWNPVTQGDITGYQVYYNGTMMNVTSSTTTLSFTAPSLPDNVFTGTVVVMVTATNRYGIGPASEPGTAVINASSVISVSLPRFSFPGNTSKTFSVTFNCTIHPDSTADQCVLRARTDDRNVTIVGSAPITNGIATVTVNELECGTNYTIVAGGTLNGDLLGPRKSVAIINSTDTCEVMIRIFNNDGDEGSSIGGIVGGVVGGVSGVVGGIITPVAVVIVYKYRKNKKNSVTDEEDQEKGGNKQKKDKQKKTAKKSKDKDTLKQQLQDDKADSPEAKNMDEGTRPSDEYAVVDKSKKPNQPVTTGGVNYADLDIGKGSDVTFGGDQAVHYAQTTSNS